MHDQKSLSRIAYELDLVRDNSEHRCGIFLAAVIDFGKYVERVVELGFGRVLAATSSVAGSKI